MFWKVLSWGAAVVMIVVGVVAYMAHGGGAGVGGTGGTGTTEQPAAEPGKKFNL